MTARRLVLAPGDLALLAGRLELQLPPAFAVHGGADDPTRLESLGVLADGRINPAVVANLTAVCSPQLGVLVEVVGTQIPVSAALGVRGDLGGSLVRTGSDAVELSLWPAVGLGAELARLVPPPAEGGWLRASVVVPPELVGQCLWSATADAWLALEPGDVPRPVSPVDLGRSLAPLVGAGLA